MEFFRKQTDFKFMKYRAVWIFISAVFFAFAIYQYVRLGDDAYSVEFSGGAQVSVSAATSVDITAVRDALDQAGLVGHSVQSYASPGVDGGSAGSSFAIRVRAEEGVDVGKKVLNALGAISGAKFDVVESQVVGPTIGREVKRAGWIAFFLSLLGILIYVWVRFDLAFAIGAIVALFHDVIIASGLYIASGRELSGAFLAAALTIVGYSVNDTIIVYDRIRENLAKAFKTGSARKRGDTPAAEFSTIVDLSVNQTLNRTILTSLTVFMIAVVLWKLGTGSASDLAFALVVGSVVGTYSTVFIASPFVLLCKRLQARGRSN